jgi:hypothetical protein
MVDIDPTVRSRRSSSAQVPKYLRVAGALVRSAFIVTLMAITWSLTIPPTMTAFARYSTGDFIRVAIGIIICVGLTVELFKHPRDDEGYRTWAHIGIGVAFVVLIFVALQRAFP